MASAASQGPMKPVAASGSASALYASAHAMFCLTRRIARRATCRVSPMLSRESFIRTTSALSCDASAPPPMAKDTSARASTGASFSPSPTIATTRPSRCSASR
jgi:hypothetical protein